jgi:HD-like signal output (HDOD) protein/CheY-like chemotaxis protein
MEAMSSAVGCDGAASPQKKRVMFVDDEPAILSGLRNLLYKQRKRWEMVFVAGGEPALLELRARPFDVVVSDMRMPGMDGATLLNQIREESPATSRIMLTGHADHDAIVRALPALHQLLSKPCDAETLRAAIERGTADAAPQDAQIRAVIGRVDRLPTPPSVYVELTGLIRSPTADVRDVARIIAGDPAISAKILQLVGSAYFGGQRTSSIQQAVTLLGIERLRYLSLSASVFGASDQEPIPELSIQGLQADAPRVADLAQALLPAEVRDAAFAGALLRDLGQVVLAQGLTTEYRRVLQHARSAGLSLLAAELELLGATHADVAACLLGLWGLPEPVVEIVRAHHAPERAPEPLRAAAAAVCFAEAVLGGGDEEAAEAAIERAGCASLLPGWREVAERKR